MLVAVPGTPSIVAEVAILYEELLESGDDKCYAK